MTRPSSGLLEWFAEIVPEIVKQSRGGARESLLPCCTNSAGKNSEGRWHERRVVPVWD